MGHTHITLSVSLIMIALFSIAIIGFAIGFANDNSAEVSITQDAEITSFYSDTSGNINQFNPDSQGTYDSISETTVGEQSGVAQGTKPFAITTGNLIDVGKNMFMVPYKIIFGSGDGFGIFFTTLGVIITFMFGLLLYKALRGNP